MDKHVRTFSQVEQQVYIIASVPIKTFIKTSRYKSQKFLTESSFCFSVAIISIPFADTVYVFIQNSPGGYLAKVIVPQNSKTQVMLRKEWLLALIQTPKWLYVISPPWNVKKSLPYFTPIWNKFLPQPPDHNDGDPK